MTNYSHNESRCRFSLFKPSGKWYEDYEVEMGDFYNEPLIHDAVKKSWARYRADRTFRLEEDWILVVLDPYHKHAHPVMIKGSGVHRHDYE